MSGIHRREHPERNIGNANAIKVPDWQPLPDKVGNKGRISFHHERQARVIGHRQIVTIGPIGENPAGRGFGDHHVGFADL